MGITCEDEQITKIKISNNSLSGTIPTVINELEKLEEIDLSFNSLSGDIPPLSNLKKLTFLNLSNNQIDISSNFSISDIPMLKILDLSFNKIRKFPLRSFQSNTTHPLKELHLSRNQIISVPSSIEILDNLNILNLGSNVNLQIEPIPLNLPSLTQLYINEILSSNLKFISQLSSLELLDISSINLSYINGSDLSNLTSLKDFRCSGNSLKFLPSELGLLTSLTKIDLSRNNFTTFDFYFPYVEELYLFQNSIKSMDVTFYNQTLKKFSVSCLQCIPKGLSNLKIVYILISGKSVYSMRDFPSTLEDLSLYASSFAEEDEYIDIYQENISFPNLKLLLSVSPSNQSKIPNWMTSCKKLEYIELELMKGTIPTEIGNLSNLKSLILANGNIIGSLPTEIGLLNNLETLKLNNLSISNTLPLEFSNLTSLKTLNLKDTKLNGIIDPKIYNLLNSINDCIFGEKELLNFNCESNSIFGQTVCNLKCRGDEMQGIWVTPLECKPMDSSNLLFYSQGFLNIKNDLTFDLYGKGSLSCNRFDEAQLYLKGKIEPKTENKINEREYSIKIKVTNIERKVVFQSYSASIASKLICNWESTQNEIIDITNRICIFPGTAFYILPISQCQSTEIEMIVNFNDQRLSFPGDKLLLYPCNNYTPPSIIPEFRRYFTCDSLSISNIQCTPICGDGYRLHEEICDDGNQLNGDGCQADCKVTPGWDCVKAPIQNDTCKYDCDGVDVKNEKECDDIKNGISNQWIIGITVMIFFGFLILGFVFYYLMKEKKYEVIIPDSDIVCHEILGQGQFGIVYKGVWRGTTEVAVKEVKIESFQSPNVSSLSLPSTSTSPSSSSSSSSEIKNFEGEAKLLSCLPPHPNIVQFLGISFSNTPICLVPKCDEKGVVVVQQQQQQQHEENENSIITPNPSTLNLRRLRLITEYLDGGDLVNFLRNNLSPVILSSSIIHQYSPPPPPSLHPSSLHSPLPTSTTSTHSPQIILDAENDIYQISYPNLQSFTNNDLNVEIDIDRESNSDLGRDRDRDRDRDREIMRKRNNRERDRDRDKEMVSLKEYLIVLGIGKGIVAGMDHLHSNNIMHRDLAARNILIQIASVQQKNNNSTLDLFENSQLKVNPKISDFGLSSVTSNSSKSVLPIRWSAPEVLIDVKSFVKSSDVWSFGVLMYEMITNCSQLPYPWISSNKKVIEFVLEGGQLTDNLDVSPPVNYLSLMRNCFSMSTQFRPSFSQLYNEMCKEENSTFEYKKNQQIERKQSVISNNNNRNIEINLNNLRGEDSNIIVSPRDLNFQSQGNVTSRNTIGNQNIIYDNNNNNDDDGDSKKSGFFSGWRMNRKETKSFNKPNNKLNRDNIIYE